MSHTDTKTIGQKLDENPIPTIEWFDGVIYREAEKQVAAEAKEIIAYHQNPAFAYTALVDRLIDATRRAANHSSSQCTNLLNTALAAAWAEQVERNISFIEARLELHRSHSAPKP